MDGNNVILHYTVGDCDVLEQPSFDDSDGLDIFVRSFQLGKSSKPLTMLVCEDDKASEVYYGGRLAKGAKFAGYSNGEIDLMTGINGAPAGTELQAVGKQVLLKIPALTAPATFTLKICSLKKDEKAKFESLIDKKIRKSILTA